MFRFPHKFQASDLVMIVVQEIKLIQTSNHRCYNSSNTLAANPVDLSFILAPAPGD